MAHAATAPLTAGATRTGVPNGKLGMWLFLASEVMFFTGLIAAYVILRFSNPDWPGSDGHLSVPIGTMNTLLLIGSSTTIVLALAAHHRGAIGAVRGWLLTTIGLGALFILVKLGIEYREKFDHHLFPATNIFWGAYYTLTGFHALHVLGGVVFNLLVLSWTFNQATWREKGKRLEYAGLYWHFVDIVWIFLFPLVYFL